MLKDVYSFENISFSMAQTLIYIALDYCSQYTAAERLKYFLIPNNYITTFNSGDEIQKLRNHYHLEFLALAKENHKSYLATVIHAFYTQKIIQNGKNRNNVDAEKVSLLDLNVSISEKELYREVMILMTSSESIIKLYMRTHSFFVEFRNWVRVNYSKDDFGRPNDLSESKCYALLQLVISRITKYSEETYTVDTLTPDSFIFGTLNLYFKDSKDRDGNYADSDVKQFFDTLNSRGQDREISGEDGSSTTALGFYGVNLNRNHTNFNFRDAAIKICKASRELYTHNSKDISFYDIFSRYRDINFPAAKYAKQLSEISRGCTLSKYEFTENFSSVSDQGTLASLRTKEKHRNDYLNIFDKILVSGGVSMREVKMIFDNQISVSKNMVKRENRCIYHVGDTTVKGDFKNSERFKKIYDGFIALKDLINFINSDENIYGVTIFNFNCSVFRDLKLANAVTDLKSYLEFGDITYELISNVPKEFDNILIRPNTEVQKELYGIQTINMFALLKNTKLNSIQKIQELEEKQEKEKTLFYNNISNFRIKVRNFSPDISYLPENYNCISDFTCDYLLRGGSADRTLVEKDLYVAMLFCQKIENPNLADPNTFVWVSKYLSALETLMTLDGVPMLNQYGWYGLNNIEVMKDYLADVGDNYVDITFEIKQSENSVAKVNTIPGENIYAIDSVYREGFVNLFFSWFFEEQEDEIPYWQKLRMLFSVNNFLLCLLSELSQVCDILVSYKDDPISVYIRMCDHLELLELDLASININRLYRLFNSIRLSYRTGECFSPAEAKKLKKTFDKYLTKYYISMFSEHDNKSYYNILKRIHQEMYDAFKPKGSLQDIDLKQQNRLAKISEELTNIYTSYPAEIRNAFFCCDPNILSHFNSCATFNDYGFATRKGTLYVTAKGSFIHRYGAVITLNVIGEKYECEPLTETQLSFYENR